MATFLTNVNLSGNQLLNARIQNLAVAPSKAELGQIFYDTVQNTLKVYNGESWIELGKMTEVEQQQFVRNVSTTLWDAFQSTDGSDMLRETIGLENSLADNLQEAKTYADKIKSDLLGSAGESYDTFKEIEEYLKDHAEALQFMDSVTRKFVTTVGDGVALEHTITHNLLSRDVVVTLRETKAPYEMVLADVAFTDENTIKIITALPLAKDELTVTAVG